MNETTDRTDVKIAGAGAVGSGKYRDVNIAGTGTLAGDVECVNLKVSGAAEGRGTLRAESMKVNGVLTYNGGVDVGTAKVNGSSVFQGSVHAGSLAVSGTVEVGEDLTGGEVDLRGFLRVKGDCEVERFVSRGGFTVEGLLNAGVVDVQLYGPCKAREIGGEAIIVRSAKDSTIRRLVATLVPSIETHLTTETIEGDDVRLEHTTARVVRGKTVVLGRDCEVELVEYTEEYSASSDAKVKKATKIGEAAS